MQVGIPLLRDYLWRRYFSDEAMGVEGCDSRSCRANSRDIGANRGDPARRFIRLNIDNT